MSSVLEVAEGLRDTITQATGLRGFAYIPDSINPPALAVTVASMDVGTFTLGQMDIMLEAAVFVSKASDRVGQLAVYEYLSPSGDKSIWRAVYNAPTLGLADTSATVKGMRSFRIEEVAAYGYYGVVFDVFVLTSGA